MFYVYMLTITKIIGKIKIRMQDLFFIGTIRQFSFVSMRYAMFK